MDNISGSCRTADSHYSHYGGSSNSASGNSASGNAPAPTKPNVVQMSTGIKLNSTVPTYFYADTVKGVIVLSPEDGKESGRPF